MRTTTRARHHFAHRPLAIATAIALLAGAGLPTQAQAQFYEYSGSVSTSPVNLFPINTSVSFLDLTGNTLSVGNSAPGSFSALTGSLLTANSVSIGNGGTGNGSVTVTGAGTQVQLGGTANRLGVGEWGVGSMTVSAGALVDATVNAAACQAPGAFCNSFIGNAAGSTGTLTITGSGSEVRAFYLGIGQVAVFAPPTDAFTFGTPGGTTTGNVNVLAGGTLRTTSSRVGVGPETAAALGAEQAYGNVTINGAGSRWVITPDSINNGGAGLQLGVHANGHAAVTVSGGGQLLIDGRGGASPGDFLNIASDGGQGSLTVTGVGSRLDILGVNPVLQVGRSGAGAQGLFSVLAGATVSTLYMNVGRDGATGTVLIDGAGSQLIQAGVATINAGSTGGSAFATIGRDGGNGQVTVSNGGRWLISDGGQDSRPGTGGSPGIQIGRGVGATGSLLITGPGSVVEIVSTSLGLPAGTADNWNPFVAVGNDNPGTTSGQLTISNGGRLLMTGNALSTETFERATTLNIGGRRSSAGTGTATVTGAGSEIALSGVDTLINVGRAVGGSGTLNVLDQARVSATSMVVGESTGGTVNVDNARIALSGFRTGTAANTGAGITVGRLAGGNGLLVMTNGASLTIENNTFAGGLSIGGDSVNPGGTGAVTLSGGSSIIFSGSVTDGSLSVGRNGSGTMTLSGASLVDVGDTRAVFVGRNAGGAGTLVVGGGSRVLAGTIGIGGDSDTVAGGVGSATVSGLGSELRAGGVDGFMSVGRSGTGTLAVTDQGTLAATVLNIGRATGGVGTLLVDNAVVNLSGQQLSSGSGAALSIGNRGGTGTATVSNGSLVNISNLGSAGASLNVGGTPLNPLGTGTLNVSGSTINVVAAPGQAIARIGHDGTGTATFTGSTLNLGDGALIIAGLPGSTGTLTLNAGSVVNAGYVGVGATPTGLPPGTYTPQNPGGTGTLIVNDSTVNAISTFEIGALGLLGGNNGVINVRDGDVIVGGTISPGDSPGRIRINCNLISLDGSRLILEVEGNGSGGFDIDHLIIGDDSTFDLRQFQIVFTFLGDTDPTAFAASGGFDLDNFLLAGHFDGRLDEGLSTLFASGETWADVVDFSRISAASSVFDIASLSFDGATGGVGVIAAPIPEPSTWALMVIGLLFIVSRAKLQQRGNNALTPRGHVTACS